jgi:hypothetical protein
MVLHGELNFWNPAFAPLSYTTFAKYFLIPHIAVVLIADDKNMDLDGAWELMSSSGSHGEVLNALHILPGESDTRLENSNLFTCYASNHLCFYPRSKPMSNDPGLDLDHHVSLIGSCSLVAHHVPQHIFQSVGSIYNLEGCHIAGYSLKDVLFNIHL